MDNFIYVTTTHWAQFELFGTFFTNSKMFAWQEQNVSVPIQAYFTKTPLLQLLQLFH